MNLRALAYKSLNAARALPGPLKNNGIRLLSLIRERWIKNMDTPKWLTLYLTNRCHLKCQHCFYWEELNSGDGEIELAEIEQIFSSLKKRLWTLSITGGEPFLRKDISDIFLMLDKMNVTNKILVSTSGPFKLVSTNMERIAEGFTGNTLLGLSVSLDGLKSTHDRIRGVKGSFDNAVQTIRHIKSISEEHKFLSVGVCTAISRENAGEIPELMKYVRDELGVDHGLDLVRGFSTDAYNVPPGIALRTASPRDGALSDFSIDEIENLHALIRSGREDGFRERIENLRMEYALEVRKTHERQFPCLAGRVDAVIYPNGDLAFCEFTRPVANLKETGYDLHSLWRSPRVNEARRKLTGCACTHPVNMMRSMAYDADVLMRIIK